VLGVGEAARRRANFVIEQTRRGTCFSPLARISHTGVFLGGNLRSA